MSRYKAVPGSQTLHCCFAATVVDTTKPVMVGGKHWMDQYEPVCECFDPALATQIAAALNVACLPSPAT